MGFRLLDMKIKQMYEEMAEIKIYIALQPKENHEYNLQSFIKMVFKLILYFLAFLLN